MLDCGDEVVVIKEETFSKIYIYGFGVITDVSNYDGVIYEIKLEDGNVIEADSNDVVHVIDWAEYVDERDARVIRVKYE